MTTVAAERRSAATTDRDGLSAEGGAAVAAAPTHRPWPGSVAGRHGPAADRAPGRVVRGQALPRADDDLVEREPAARPAISCVTRHVRSEDRRTLDAVQAEVEHQRGHATFRNSPTTRPRT